MFKKQQSISKEICDSTIVVYDFKLRSSVKGFEGYHCTHYKIFDEFSKENMLPMLDQQLDKLFAKDSLDSANVDVLTNLLLSRYSQAIQNLNTQQVEHFSLNNRLANRFIADKNDILESIEIDKKIVEELQKEYLYYSSLVEANKSKTTLELENKGGDEYDSI